eukprot:m.832173 g.832173  ORF g.832173 m.832173 type:complete len:64 (+) comp23434_c0_seq4:173-364(+)
MVEPTRQQLKFISKYQRKAIQGQECDGIDFSLLYVANSLEIYFFGVVVIIPIASGAATRLHRT